MYVVNSSPRRNYFICYGVKSCELFKNLSSFFTPKGLLRHPDCVSSLTDLAQGSFQEILDDPLMPKKAKRIAFCSGRIYYDLIAMRAKTKTDDLAFIRIEQLYPLHVEKIKALLKHYMDQRNSSGFRRSHRIWELGILFPHSCQNCYLHNPNYLCGRSEVRPQLQVHMLCIKKNMLPLLLFLFYQTKALNF